MEEPTEAEAGSASPPPRHWRINARQARETGSKVRRRRSLEIKEWLGEEEEEDEEAEISGALWWCIDFMANLKKNKLIRRRKMMKKKKNLVRSNLKI